MALIGENIFISLVFGTIIGFLLALPPGPVAITAMKVTLNQGSKEGSFVGLGTGVVDFLFCLVAVFATSAFLSLVKDLMDNHPVVVLIFQIIIIISIIIFGLRQLKWKKKSNDELKSMPSDRLGFFHYLSTRGPFLLGVAIALSNIANPTFFPSLMYMTLTIQKFAIVPNISSNNFAFAAGFGFGNFLWIYLLVKIVSHYKSKVSDSTIEKFHRFAGILLIIVGILLGYRVMTFTKWFEIYNLLFIN